MAGFVILVSLSGTQLYLLELPDGRSVSFVYIFVGNLIACLPWIPLGMGILWLTARFPLGHKRGVAVHLAARRW